MTGRAFKVAAIAVAVIAGLGAIAAWWQLREQRRDEQRLAAEVGAGLAGRPAPAPTRADEPADSMIEFELAIGERRFEVTDEAIDLGDGVTVRVVERPQWTHVGPGFSFRHAPSVSVGQGDSGVVVASVAGAALQLSTVAIGSDERALQTLVKPFVESGQADDPQPAERTIAGKSVRGRRLRVATMDVEAYATKLDGTPLRLGVVLFVRSPDADVAPLASILESVEAGEAEPSPHVDLLVDGAEEGVPLTLGRSSRVSLGGEELSVTLERRPRVLRDIAGVHFEHPHGVTVSEQPSELLTMIAVESDAVAVSIAAPPPGLFGPGELEDSLMRSLPVVDQEPVQRTVAGDTYEGAKLRLDLGVPLVTELYLFERGGRRFAAIIQYAPDAASEVAAVVDPILETLR